MRSILIVDDDENILKVIKMRLEAEEYRVATAMDAEQAVKLYRKEAVDLAVVDLKLVEKDGIQLMEELHSINPELPVIILTAHGTIETAVEAMKKGAHNYLTKPFDYQELLAQIEKCMEMSRLSREVKRLQQIVKDKYGFENIIGRSAEIRKVLAQVAQAAEADSNVYIGGESGTGKELIARQLHLASPRCDGPFVALNCAAIPETLMESELFGYEKGAFTGADRNKSGLFMQAGGGYLFLDEVSEIPITMQAKFLRALDEKEFYPLGSSRSIKTDARIIAASNINLEEAVEKGRFREDLFYRIHVIVITLPPLRQRKEDIPLLAKHFLQKYAKTMNKKIRGFSPAALQKLMLHHWPGNVRELENAVESAVAMSLDDVIGEDLILRTRDIKTDNLKALKDAKADFERNYLIQLIELTNGNLSRAAKLAGKYRADLYALLRRHNLNPKDFRKN